jgi:hypothetical protein
VLQWCACHTRGHHGPALGYENVQVLAGGTKAWREAGLPIEKKA